MAQDLGLCCLHLEPKSTIILTLMLAEFSMAGTLSIFFIYTAELLPTVLRYGVWWVEVAWGMWGDSDKIEYHSIIC